MAKQLLKHPLVMRLLGWLMAHYIRLVFHSSRITRDIPEASDAYVRGEQQAVFCFWHGRMIMQPVFIPHARSIHVLISHHRDGEMIAGVLRHFGIGAVRGSTSRGALGALKTILRLLKAGDNIAITPDGPRGPACEVAPGALTIAKMSGAPIIPVSFSASKARHMRSWDSFLLPWPFGRIALVVGAPMHIAADADDAALASATATLQTAINDATAHADALCGRGSI